MKVLILLSVISITLALRCHLIDDQAQDTELSSDDMAECSGSDNACFMTEYQRGSNMYRDYGCYATDNGKTTSACPLVNRGKRSQDEGEGGCLLGNNVDYADRTLNEGETGVRECLPGYKADVMTPNADLHHCFNGDPWLDYEYNGLAEPDGYIEMTCIRDSTYVFVDYRTLGILYKTEADGGSVEASTYINENIIASCDTESGIYEYNADRFGRETVLYVNPESGFFTFTEGEDDVVDLSALSCIVSSDWAHISYFLAGVLLKKSSDDTLIYRDDYTDEDLVATCDIDNGYAYLTTGMFTSELIIYKVTGVSELSFESASGTDYAQLTNLGCDTVGVIIPFMEGGVVLTKADDPEVTYKYDDFVFVDVIASCDTTSGYSYMPDDGSEGKLKAATTLYVGQESGRFSFASDSVDRVDLLALECMQDQGKFAQFTSNDFNSNVDVLVGDEVYGEYNVGRAYYAVGTTATVQCQEDYTTTSWTSPTVLTFAEATGDGFGYFHLEGSTDTVSINSFEACGRPVCELDQLRDLNFIVLNIDGEGDITATKPFGGRVLLECSMPYYTEVEVEGYLLHAYRCGSDGTFGKIYLECSEYVDCTTLVACSDQDGCNGTGAIYTSLTLLVFSLLLMI